MHSAYYEPILYLYVPPILHEVSQRLDKVTQWYYVVLLRHYMVAHELALGL